MNLAGRHGQVDPTAGEEILVLSETVGFEPRCVPQQYPGFRPCDQAKVMLLLLLDGVESLGNPGLEQPQFERDSSIHGIDKYRLISPLERETAQPIARPDVDGEEL